MDYHHRNKLSLATDRYSAEVFYAMGSMQQSSPLRTGIETDDEQDLVASALQNAALLRTERVLL